MYILYNVIYIYIFNNVLFIRLLAKNAALAYYWIVVGLYMLNPRGAYHLSQVGLRIIYDTTNEWGSTCSTRAGRGVLRLRRLDPMDRV